MLIGIDGSRAFIKNRTGIEEYSYQTIKHLRGKLKNHRVVLYIRHNQKVDFDLSADEAGLPENWKVKKLWAPRFWTQIRLSLEIFFNPIDMLFVPAHTVPFIHPKNSVVTIHGLEYEVFPETYSRWERFYMRWSIKNSCQWASRIISVSENTKKDLMRLYAVPEEKIAVIYEGYDQENIKTSKHKNKTTCHSGLPASSADGDPESSEILNRVQDDKYLLFVGRLEARKNIIGIIRAFEILKEKHNIPHKLILAGGKGHGYKAIKHQIESSKYKENILLPGFVSEEEKWKLLKNADVFLFPTFYEGFGIPVLEAQSVGTPVVAGNNSSILEVTTLKPLLPSGEGARRADEGGSENNQFPHPNSLQKGEEDNASALLADPNNPEEIAQAVHKLISDENLKNDIIEKGNNNVKRFSWEKCAGEIATVITGDLC